MSCIKDKYSIDAKKLYLYLLKFFFVDFSLSVLFPSGKTLGFWFFSYNSRVILKISRAKALKIFNITLELYEKNRNPSVLPDGNNTGVEKTTKEDFTR